jgi:hypothetical protein
LTLAPAAPADDAESASSVDNNEYHLEAERMQKHPNQAAGCVAASPFLDCTERLLLERSPHTRGSADNAAAWCKKTL